MNVDEDIIRQAKQYICGYDEVPEGYKGLWAALIVEIIRELCIEKMEKSKGEQIPLLSILESGTAENKKAAPTEVIKSSDARLQNEDEIPVATLKALSKQVPMKPVLVKNDFNCPVCGWPITSEDAKGLQGVNGFNLFCNHCGQALEWRRRDD